MWDRHFFRSGRWHTAGDTTSDVTPPTISGVDVVEGETSATIAWSLDEPGDGLVEYGTSLDYTHQTTAQVIPLTWHRQTMSGLTAGTLYYYNIVSKDATGNVAESAGTFTTTGAIVPPPDPGDTGATVFGIGYVGSGKTDCQVKTFSGENDGNPAACRFTARKGGVPRYIRHIWKSVVNYGKGDGGTYTVGVQSLDGNRRPSGTWLAYRTGWQPGFGLESTAFTHTMTTDVASLVAGVEYAVVVENTHEDTVNNFGSWNKPRAEGAARIDQPVGSEMRPMYWWGDRWGENTSDLTSFDLEYDSGEHEGAAGVQGRDSVYGHDVVRINSASIGRWVVTYPAAYGTISVDAVVAALKRISGTGDISVSVRVNNVEQATATITGAAIPTTSPGCSWERATLSSPVTIDPGDELDVRFTSSSSFEINGMIYQTGANAPRSWPYTEGGGAIIHRYYDGSTGTTAVEPAWVGHWTAGIYLEIA